MHTIEVRPSFITVVHDQTCPGTYDNRTCEHAYTCGFGDVREIPIPLTRLPEGAYEVVAREDGRPALRIPVILFDDVVRALAAADRAPEEIREVPESRYVELSW